MWDLIVSVPDHCLSFYFILGVNKRVVNLAIKGERGRFPVSFSCIIQAFKYWYHLQESSNSLLLRL